MSHRGTPGSLPRLRRSVPSAWMGCSSVAGVDRRTGGSLRRAGGPMGNPDNSKGNEIAIIGMAGRFPGAVDVDQFWRNLCQGVESVRSFTADELTASGIDPAVLEDPAYVNAGIVLE